ncbi:unnamed protein product [Miscanthus lutarioriparius]|uniref:Uncharacterized protein n=1 Tax=Miscanthus lutarioriparius TaxID=422564 RepID=A0A811Q4M1_9POAL|nr:unnamed protein product [Miscanthus lutarioriparius]
MDPPRTGFGGARCTELVPDKVRSALQNTLKDYSWITLISTFELREQLAAEATAAVQGEIDELRKRSEEAEEKLVRTQKEMEEYKKLTEISNKAMEENNALLKRILAINNASLI